MNLKGAFSCIGMLWMSGVGGGGVLLAPVEWSGGPLVARDDTARELLRGASPAFLEGSPGRDLAIDISCSEFRFDVWPRVTARCLAFEGDHKGELPTPELLVIVADAAEDHRAREMGLWLLAARLTNKEDEGRPAAAPRLLPFGPEGIEGLAQALSPFLESGDRVTRYSAVAVIGAHGAADSAAALVRAIKSPYLPERAAACRAIGRFGPEGLGVEGVGLLRPLIYEHPDIAVTQAATRALLLAGTLEFERSGQTTLIDELVRAVRYAPHAGEPRNRKDFGSWGTPDKEYVVGFTAEEVASGVRADAFIRYCAAVALSHVDMHELQRHAFAPMLEALGDNEVSVVVEAFRFVDRLGVRALDWSAGPVVVTLLRASDPFLSSRSVWTVSLWGERMAEHVLLIIERSEATLKAHGDVFYHLWALGNSGDTRAENYLLGLRQRIGPQTRPLDSDGHQIDNDSQYLKVIDDGLARIRQTREIRGSPDPAVQGRALSQALASHRRLYLVPTLLDVIRDRQRTEEMRVRCARALREIDVVGAPAWFAEVLASQADLPARLREALEQERPPRREDE